MKTFSLLFLCISIHLGMSLPLTDSLDSEERSNDIGYGDSVPVSSHHNDWVKISQPPPSTVSKLAGATIELNCEAVGSPAPTIQWLKDGKPVTDNEPFDNNLINDNPSRGLAKIRSKLLIHSVLSVQEGKFTCLAEAGSKIATAASLLYVQSTGNQMNFTQLLHEKMLGARTQPTITLYNTIYMDDIGNEVVLPCKAAGHPRPSVMWLDNNDNIVGKSGRVSVLPDGELRIQNIRWADMGPYRCIADNIWGQDSISTFLYPMLPEK